MDGCAYFFVNEYELLQKYDDDNKWLFPMKIRRQMNKTIFWSFFPWEASKRGEKHHDDDYYDDFYLQTKQTSFLFCPHPFPKSMSALYKKEK